METLTGVIISLDKLPLGSGRGWRWEAEIEDDKGIITLFSGLGVIPDLVREAYQARAKVSVPVKKKGGFINYDPQARGGDKSRGEAPIFKPASEENSPRERAIRDAIVIGEDAQRVFEKLWGFRPEKTSPEGVWAAYNSIYIYLSRR